MKKRLSPRTIRALKPGKDGIRHGDVVMDDITPNFGVRILGTAERPQHTFCVVARFPGRPHPTRAAIAPFVFDKDDEAVGAESLKAARAKARRWIRLIEEHRDPRLEEARKREAMIREQATTVGAVAGDFITQKLRTEIADTSDKTGSVVIDGKHWRYLERRGADVEREIRKELRAWWPRPISEITRGDITRIIKAKAKTAPASARNLLGHLRRLFQWAIDQDSYDIQMSPVSGIKPTAIIGEKIARDRVLDDTEFRAFWIAAGRLPYPQGPMFQLLALTGCRLAGVSDARWSEFSPVVRDAIRRSGDHPVDWAQFSTNDLWWTIPATRVKGKNSKARPFMVPLTVDMLKILETLPSFAGGPFLFSRTGGETPAVISTEIKGDLDAKIFEVLRELAQQRGAEPDSVELQPWVTHDLRRVVRSALSRLRVPQEVAETVLGHVRPGIQGVYDQHTYFDEKRDALLKWGALLRSIVEPSAPTSNVVTLRA
jgi:integrase